MSEKMREEFEKIFGNIDHNTDESDRRAYDGDWFTWKNAWIASRAALCVELPKPPDPRGGMGDYDYSRKQAIDDCRAAIESQGVRTK